MSFVVPYEDGEVGGVVQEEFVVPRRVLVGNLAIQRVQVIAWRAAELDNPAPPRRVEGRLLDPNGRPYQEKFGAEIKAEPED